MSTSPFKLKEFIHIVHPAHTCDEQAFGEFKMKLES